MITEAHKHHFWAKLSHCSNVSNFLDSSRYAKLVKTWWPHWWLGLPARNHCISEIPHLLWTWDRNSKPSTLLAELQPFTNLKNSCYHIRPFGNDSPFFQPIIPVTSRCEVAAPCRWHLPERNSHLPTSSTRACRWNHLRYLGQVWPGRVLPSRTISLQRWNMAVKDTTSMCVCS